jgi:hypothetical protein
VCAGKQGCIHLNESDEKVNAARQKRPDFGLVSGTNPTKQTHKARRHPWKTGKYLGHFLFSIPRSFIHKFIQKRRAKKTNLRQHNCIEMQLPVEAPSQGGLQRKTHTDVSLSFS